MSLFFLLNPKNFGYDQADVYVKARKYKALKRQEEREEEAIAAQLVLERLQAQSTSNGTVKEIASEIVQPLFSETSPYPDLSKKRIRRVKMLVILMLLDIL
jgi:hypothetical protein